LKILDTSNYSKIECFKIIHFCGETKIQEFADLKQQKNNPLHGITLEKILIELVDKIGWIEMNRRVQINCFFSHPSIKSSLKFLRKETWARKLVEEMYLELVSKRKKDKGIL